jgi:hypothetical protein
MRIELLSTSRIEPVLPASSTARMPQHDPAWLDVLRDTEERADALLAIDHDAVVGYLPFSIRESAIGTVLSSQPYVAYGGPVAHDDSADITQKLFVAYRDLASEHHAVVAAVGTPPLLDEAIEARWREQFAPTFVTENSRRWTGIRSTRCPAIAATYCAGTFAKRRRRTAESSVTRRLSSAPPGARFTNSATASWALFRIRQRSIRRSSIVSAASTSCGWPRSRGGLPAARCSSSMIGLPTISPPSTPPNSATAIRMILFCSRRSRTLPVAR